MCLRTWIEKAADNDFRWSPVYIGKKNGRNFYLIEWADGTDGSYFIDFEKHEIEEI